MNLDNDGNILVYVVVFYCNFKVLKCLLDYVFYVDFKNFYGDIVLYVVIIVKVREDVFMEIV